MASHQAHCQFWLAPTFSQGQHGHCREAGDQLNPMDPSLFAVVVPLYSLDHQELLLSVMRSCVSTLRCFVPIRRIEVMI
jgi:hypothetical protein